jgi:hypothetical protein
MIKPLAFYLPAFYPFPENNKFWGDGFTEWDNIKKWEPSFEGHFLKEESFELEQYDTRSYATRKRHAELAKKNGIYGFVYYHFWFYGYEKEKVLHTATEKILVDGEPDIPFCFEWANEPWTSTWDGKENNVLIPQTYGEPSDWTRHFNYLNQFFKHKNYIKVDNKPMMCIYRIGHFQRFNEFKDHFNNLAKLEGFDGIHFVQLLNHFTDTPGIYDQHADAYAEYQPMFVNRYTASHIEINDKYIKQNIVAKWEEILRITPSEEHIANKEYYRGIHVGWDSSPRGRNRFWSVDVGSTPELFSKYAYQQARQVIADPFNKENFLFIFAWNEWGEGAVLEPDNLYGNQYLKFFGEMIHNI